MDWKIIANARGGKKKNNNWLLFAGGGVILCGIIAFAICKGYEVFISKDQVKLNHVTSVDNTCKLPVGSYDANQVLIPSQPKNPLPQSPIFPYDINDSVKFVDCEINNNRRINMRTPVCDENRKLLYKHLQHCLNVIGEFNSHISGDQQQTYDAVISFQKNNKLDADGIVGKKTWQAIKDKINQE